MSKKKNYQYSNITGTFILIVSDWVTDLMDSGFPLISSRLLLTVSNVLLSTLISLGEFFDKNSLFKKKKSILEILKNPHNVYFFIVTAVIVNVSKYYIQSGFLLEKIYHHFKNINITSAFQTSGLSYDCNKIFLNINFNIMCLGNNRSITCISYQNTSKCRPAYSVHRLLNGGAGTTLHVLHFLPEPDVLQTVLRA